MTPVLSKMVNADSAAPALGSARFAIVLRQAPVDPIEQRPGLGAAQALEHCADQKRVT
jgi:hypothetical protein